MIKLPKSAKKHPTVAVNLLPQDPFLDSVIGKFLTWALSIGRYLIIITEFIVIMSFLSRFKLDRDLTDLTENIERQKAVILSYEDVERNFTSVQQKINFIAREQENQSIIPTLSFIEKNLPLDTKLTQLNVQPNNWSVTAAAVTAQSMKSAVDRIAAAYPQNEVSLGEVKLNGRTGTIDFSIRVSQPTTVVKKAVPVANESSSETEE
jgi:hypothetical protein